MKNLNPSFPEHGPNYTFAPSDVVFVPVLIDSALCPMSDPLLCNIAYDSIEAAAKHFWFRTAGMNAKLKKMTVEQFLKTHDWRGMNPFETLNKMEFLAKYRELYPDIEVRGG